jgi:O-antigen ligase
MFKDNFLEKWKHNQNWIAVICILGMVAGFMTGRAILSLFMFLFFINTVALADYKKIKLQKFWLIGLIWFLFYVLSYFWSEDIPYWIERVQVKFPLLILPLAFGLQPALLENQKKWIVGGITLFTILGCCYSLSFYFSNSAQIIEDVFKSKVFKTPAYSDHIRYSIFTAWVTSLAFIQFLKNQSDKKSSVIWLLVFIFLTLYLHILAVKSGLITLYLFFACYTIYTIIKKQWKIAGLIGLIMVIGSISLYNQVPTFREKLHYVKYTAELYQSGSRSVEYSDIGRLVSYELGINIFLQNPIFGVGAGDVRSAMFDQYQKNQPSMSNEQYLVPHNQLLEILVIGGVVLFVLFLAWLLYPMINWPKNGIMGFWLVSTWVMIVTACQFEPMLEIQFGIFVFLFCLFVSAILIKTPENETQYY